MDTSATPKNDWRSRATITVEQAAPILGIGRSTAYALARADEIPTIRLGRRLLVPTTRLRVLLGELPANEASPAGQRDSQTTAEAAGHHAES